MTTQISEAFIKSAKSINVEVDIDSPFIKLIDRLAEIDKQIAQEYCSEVLSVQDVDELVCYINYFAESDYVIDLFFHGFDFADSNLGEDHWNRNYKVIERHLSTYR